MDRATFDTKRNEIQLKIDRLKVKIKAHEKANNSFDDTILGLLDITTELHEQKQSLVNQDLQANYNQQLQFGCGKSHEVAQSLKNKGVAKIFATPLQFGRGSQTRTDTA